MMSSRVSKSTASRQMVAPSAVVPSTSTHRTSADVIDRPSTRSTCCPRSASLGSEITARPEDTKPSTHRATQPFPIDSARHNWRVTSNDGGMYFWLDYVDGAQPYFDVPAFAIDDCPFPLPHYREFPVL